MPAPGVGIRLPLTLEFREWLGTQNLYQLSRAIGLPHESPLYRLQKGWTNAHGKRYPIKTLSFDLAERIVEEGGLSVNAFWPDA